MMKVNSTWMGIANIGNPKITLGTCSAENSKVLMSHTLPSPNRLLNPTIMLPRVIISSPNPTPTAPNDDHTTSSAESLPDGIPKKLFRMMATITTGRIQTHGGPDFDLSNRTMRNQPRMLMATTRTAHPNNVGNAYQSFVVSAFSPIRL